MLNRIKPKSEFSRNLLTLMTGTTIAQAIPIAEMISDEIMSLLMNPYVRDDEIKFIGDAL